MSDSRLQLKRFQSCSGQVRLPGSKSIANRALLLSALSNGKTRLQNLPDADDIEVLLRALHALGVSMSFAASSKESSQQTPEWTPVSSDRDFPKILKERHEIQVEGAGGQFPKRDLRLDLENAGTALRPLVAALCAMHGSYLVTGNEQMQRRPIRDLVEALRKLGADIEDTDGCPPVRIRAEGMRGGRVQLPGSVSSQFLSALLLASPLSEGELVIRIEDELVSKPYVDLTLAVLRIFGVEIQRTGYQEFCARPRQEQSLQTPGSYYIEGDASAATYFLGAGALPGSGPIIIEGLGSDSIQGDLQFTALLKEMGARVELGSDSIRVQGPPAGARLRALDRDMNAMPDAAMTLAVLALFCDGTTHIRNIANLRVKESERIRGLHTELEKLGASVEEEEDALHITPPGQIRRASIETYQDHRMAMAFSLAAYGTELEILDPACVSKTYRGFFEDFLPLCK